MAYMFKIGNGTLPDQKKYPEIKVLYNLLNNYDGRKFETLDDFYLNVVRKAAETIIRMPNVADKNIKNNGLRLFPIPESENKIVGCLTESASGACRFGLLEKIVK